MKTKSLKENPLEKRDIFTENLGNLVKIRGTMHPQRNKIIMNGDSFIQNIETLPLKQFFIDGKMAMTKTPFEFRVSLGEDKFVLKNDELNILAVSDSLREAADNVREQVYLLWKEFVDVPEKNIDKSALPLRKLLKENLVFE